MNITRCLLAAFSPCGGTLAVLRAIAAGLEREALELDLTLPQAREKKQVFGPDDLVLLGFPVYGGRLPYPAADAFATLSGNGAAAVLVAVYGNRAYEDALMELRREAEARGFVPVAAVAAVAEHVMVPEVAASRPDDADKENLARFGAALAAHLGSLPGDAAGAAAAAFAVPGQFPYEKETLRRGIGPATGDACVRCGLCATVCPTGSIPKDAPETTVAANCMMCMACIRKCPHQARAMTFPGFADLGAKLKEHCMARREPEFFPPELMG